MSTTISDSADKEHHCQQCNLRLYGIVSWRQHLESRGHRRREKFEDLFALNSDDMFIDENSAVEKMLLGVHGLAGLEHVVEDRTNEEMKCMLCRVLLKDKTTLVEHLRTYKHQLNYLEKNAPDAIRSMQKNPSTKSDLAKFVQTSCDEFLKKFGRQKVRVYEKGYSEKRRQKLADLRANSGLEADDILAKSSKCFPVSTASVEEFDEMPKNALVMQTLLNANIVEFQPGETSHINDVIKNMSGPILGLEYVAEYAHPNGDFEQGYFCTLCESVMNSGQLVNHITRQDHKLKFLARDHSNYHNIISFPGFTQERREELLRKYGTEVEKDKGRMYISSRIILPPNSEFLFRYHKRIKPAIGTFDPSVKVLGTAAASFMSFHDMEGTELAMHPPAGISANSLLQHLQAQENQQLQLRQAEEHSRLQVRQLQQRTTASELQAQLAQTLASALLTNIQSLVPAQRPLVPPQQAHAAGMFVPQQFTVPPPQLMAPPPQLTVPPPHLAQPPFFQTNVEGLVIPRKPSFAYSGRGAEFRLQQDQVEGESATPSSIPLFAVKNTENEWFSDRSLSLDYHAQRFPAADYISLRYPGVRHSHYGEWSPYLMRRLQDQFNFELDHLAWLQNQFLHWRTPQYQPLERVDLRPLEDEVEVAVLEVCIGQTLKPGRSTKERKLFDYPIESDGGEKPKKSKKLEETQIFDYQHSALVEKIFFSAAAGTSVEEKAPSPKTPAFFNRKLKNKSENNTLSNWELKNGDNLEKIARSNTSSSPGTPPKSNTPDDVHQKAIMALSQDFLKIAQHTKVENAVVKLLLSYGNAEKILYNLATKDQKMLHEIVAIIKNPSGMDYSHGALSDWKVRFDFFSKS